MLLKLLFTALAILWLYEAVTRISHNSRRDTRNNYRDQRPLDNDDFTDYEEIETRRKQREN